ncbi:MAG: Error-prone repair homolog of DNA polymerase III alpha subunit, partial [uncultured Solirubrobacteraceae bacterium]
PALGRDDRLHPAAARLRARPARRDGGPPALPVGQGLLRGRRLPEDRPARARDALGGRALRGVDRGDPRRVHRPLADPVRRPADLRGHPGGRHHGRLPDREPRADGVPAPHPARVARRPHDPGRDRAARADRRRGGQPVHRAQAADAGGPGLRRPLPAPVARARPARHARHDHLPGPGARGRDGVRRLLARGGRGAAAGDEPQALRRGDRGPPRALRGGRRAHERGGRRHRRAGVGDGPGLLGLRLPQGPRRGVRAARLPVDLAAGPLQARVPVRAAQRAAHGLLSRRRARARGPAGGRRRRDRRRGRQRERRRVHGRGRRARAAGARLRRGRALGRGGGAGRGARARWAVHLGRRPRVAGGRGPPGARVHRVVGRVRRAGRRAARRAVAARGRDAGDEDRRRHPALAAARRPRGARAARPGAVGGDGRRLLLDRPDPRPAPARPAAPAPRRGARPGLLARPRDAPARDDGRHRRARRRPPAARHREGDRLHAHGGRVRDDQPHRPARPLRAQPPHRALRAARARRGAPGEAADRRRGDQRPRPLDPAARGPGGGVRRRGRPGRARPRRGRRPRGGAPGRRGLPGGRPGGPELRPGAPPV